MHAARRRYGPLADGAHTLRRARDRRGRQHRRRRIAHLDGRHDRADATIDAARPIRATSRRRASSSTRTSRRALRVPLDGARLGACASPQLRPACSPTARTASTCARPTRPATPAPPPRTRGRSTPIAPTATIDAGPADPSNDTAPSFEFSADEPARASSAGSTAAPGQPCTQPARLRGCSADGAHTLRRCARPTRAGNTGDRGRPTPGRSTRSRRRRRSTPGRSGPTNERRRASASPPTEAGDASSAGSTRPTAAPARQPAGLRRPRRRRAQLRASAPPTPPATPTDAATHTWTVDTVAPETTHRRRPERPDRRPTPTFAFSSEAGATLPVPRRQRRASPPARAPHTYRRAQPTAPTRSRSAPSTPPATWSDAGEPHAGPSTRSRRRRRSTPARAARRTTRRRRSRSRSEPGASFQCRVDSGAVRRLHARRTRTAALGDGAHTFDVRATDAAGNTDADPGEPRHHRRHDAPQTTITQAPPATTTSTTAHVHVHRERDRLDLRVLARRRRVRRVHVAARLQPGSRPARTRSASARATPPATSTPPRRRTHGRSPRRSRAAAPAVTAAADRGRVDRREQPDQQQGHRLDPQGPVQGPARQLPRARALHAARRRRRAARSSRRRSRLFAGLGEDRRARCTRCALAGPWTENQVNWSNQPATTGTAGRGSLRSRATASGASPRRCRRCTRARTTAS